MRFKNNLYQQLNESAAGSATTRLQEGLHCVLFGAKQKRSKLDISIFDDPDLLESAYNTYCSVDAPFGELYAFGQKETSWAESILKATDALFASGWLKGKYTFHRGDAYMNSIYEQFNVLKKKDDIKIANDKWNPGDIWASKGVAIPAFDNLASYNAWIGEMLHSGKLIGISLKKVAKSGSAKVVLEGEPGVKIKKIKFTGVKKPKEIYPTGIVLLTDGDYGINFRSFRISKQADITGEILVLKGGGARHGKVPSSSLKEMIKKYNIPQMQKSAISKMSDKDLYNIVLELWANTGNVFPKNEIDKSIEKRKGKIQDRVGYWQSIIHALEIASFMSSNTSVSNEIMNTWFQGAKSVGGSSSQFIKVY